MSRCILFFVFFLYTCVVFTQPNFNVTETFFEDQWGSSHAIADINNDGLNDLITVGDPPPGVVFLRIRIYYQNESNELNEQSVDIAMVGATAFRGITVEDIDQNGWLDIIIARGPEITIVYQNSEGDFTNDSWSDMDADIYGFGVGDLNNDGLPDVVYNDQLDLTYTIAFQQTDNSFVHVVQDNLFEIHRCRDFLIEDVNNDGLEDLVVGGYSLNQERDILLFLQTDSGFSNMPDAKINTVAESIEVGDVNNDGLLDVITTREVWVLQSDLTEYVQTETLRTGINNTGVEVGDINCDGYLDIVTSHSGFSDLSLYLGSAIGFEPLYEIELGFYYTDVHALAIGDLNSDDRPDISLGKVTTNNGNVVIYNETTPLSNTYVVVDTFYFTGQLMEDSYSNTPFSNIAIDSTEACLTTYTDNYMLSITSTLITDTLYTRLYKQSELCGMTFFDSTTTFILEYSIDVLRDTTFISQTIDVEDPCIIPHDQIIHLYPNPSSGLVNVTLPRIIEDEILKLEIFDMVGKLIYSGQITESPPDNELELDLSFLSDGAYTVVVTREDRCYGRLIISKSK